MFKISTKTYFDDKKTALLASGDHHKYLTQIKAISTKIIFKNPYKQVY